MYEIWLLVFGMIGIPAGFVGLVYMGSSVWAQLRDKVTPQSIKRGRIGLWYYLVLDITWALSDATQVYTVGATNGNLTWLFLGVVSLLITAFLLRNSE